LRGRVGIATGLVLIGHSAGDDPAAEHAVSGETPYVAARLQSLGGAGQVVISAATRQLVRNLFEYREVSAPPATAGTTGASLVVGESRIASRFEALRSSRSRLIGRDEDLNLLLRRWTQAKDGEGRVVSSGVSPALANHVSSPPSGRDQGEPHTSMRYFCSPHRMQTALHP
jgi:class 3 adenylate cyclase